MENGHADIRLYMESIDKRLESLQEKVNSIALSVVTKGECKDCRSQHVDKRYFLGISGGLSIFVLMTNWVMNLIKGG